MTCWVCKGTGDAPTQDHKGECNCPPLEEITDKGFRKDCPIHGETSLVERLEAMSAKLYKLAQSFPEHNLLTGEAFDEDGRAIVEGVIALDEAATALRERGKVGPGRRFLADEIATLRARVAELEAGLNKIVFEGNHNSAGYTVQCQIARSLLSKEP